MKKVLITLIILFVGFVGYSQEKTQYIGLPDNIVEVRNKLRVNALKDATGDSVWVSDAMGNAKLKAIQDFTGIKTKPDSLYLQSPIYSVKQLNDNGDTIQVVKFKIDSLPRLRYLALTRDTTTWDDTTLIDKGYLNDRLANISVSGSGDNIYTADGTLSGDRAVSLDGHLLTIGVETNNAIGMGEGEVIIGDFSGIGNSTYIDIQDGNQVVFINANNGIIYNTPPSGTSTDSILTWDADSKTIRKINRDSLSGSTPSLQDVTDVGASTTNNLTLNQANLSINDNGVTLFDTNDGSYAALYTTGTGGTGSGGRLQLSKESGGMATLEAANIGSSVTIQLPYILSGSGNLAEGITDGITTVHADTDGIIDISSLLSGGEGGSYQLPYNGNSTDYLGGDTAYHALPVYTASNGLSKIGNDFQVGGELNDNVVMYDFSNGNHLVLSSNSTALSLNGRTNFENESVLPIFVNTSDTSLVAYALNLSNNSSNGLGAKTGILFSTSPYDYQASIVSQTTDSVSGIYSADFYFNTTRVGEGILTPMILKSTGQTILPKYGSGTFTGTATYNLGVTSDGEVIETVSDASSNIAVLQTDLDNTQSFLHINTTVFAGTQSLYNTEDGLFQFKFGDIDVTDQSQYLVEIIDNNPPDLYYSIGFSAGFVQVMCKDSSGAYALPPSPIRVKITKY